MQTMKATLHIGRLKGKTNACHNDRSFNTAENENIIHPELAKYNQYYVTDDDGKFQQVEAGTGAFERREREFYRDHFKAGLDAKNERYIVQRHEENCKSITALRKGERTAPTEIILQLGSEANPYYDNAKSAKMMRQMLSRIRAQYPQFKILDVAIHYDETSAHAHIRGVYVAKDRFGYDVPNQTQALQDMGIERPDPTAGRSKNNNEMMSFTAQLRDTWYDTIEMIDPEITIDRAVTGKAKHKATTHKEVAGLEEKKANLEADISALTTRLAKERQELAKLEADWDKKGKFDWYTHMENAFKANHEAEYTRCWEQFQDQRYKKIKAIEKLERMIDDYER